MGGRGSASVLRRQSTARRRQRNRGGAGGTTSGNSHRMPVERLKTFNDRARYMKSHYGITVDSGISTLPDDVQNIALGGVEQTLKAYPQFSQSVKRISVGHLLENPFVRSDNAIAVTFTQPGTRQIVVNSKYYTTADNLRKIYADGAKHGFYTKGGTARHATVHEAAHAIVAEAYLRKYKNNEDEWSEHTENPKHLYKTDPYKDVMKAVLADKRYKGIYHYKSFDYNSFKNVTKSGTAKRARERRWAAEEFIHKHISGYASIYRPHEVLAEAISDVVENKSKADPLGKSIAHIVLGNGDNQ